MTSAFRPLTTVDVTEDGGHAFLVEVTVSRAPTTHNLVAVNDAQPVVDPDLACRVTRNVGDVVGVQVKQVRHRHDRP